MNWSNRKLLNNFWRSRLGGLEGSLHSCLQICNNSHLFVSIKNYYHILATIVDKPNRTFFCNGATWHLTTIRDKKSQEHTSKTFQKQKFLNYLFSLYMCLQFFHIVYIGGETKLMWWKSTIKRTFQKDYFLKI
jgi:predicted small integral membrane protein